MTSAPPATSRRAPADALWEAVERAKSGHPLAPVTVVIPSPYAAVAARRRLALEARAPHRPAVAAVECTTLDHLARRLGAPGLARRGLRPVPAAVESETVRSLAAAGPGSWPRLGNHPRTLVALQYAFAELRRMTPADLEALAGRPLRGADVAA
ncbi:MAG TPA: hypothetical protein VEG62_08845, partial [Acidimicrobiales bacterium]|nr:hypothetical protein [Acidimicrobiales bacterium]